MTGFLKIDFELLQSGLSAGAAILYAFIDYRMFKAPANADGERYINWTDDNDPRLILNMTNKQLRSRMEELKAAGLVRSEGHGESYKVYLSNAQKGACPNAQKGTRQTPKRALVNAQKGAWSNKNNKQYSRNSRMCVEKNNTHAPVIIPTIDEIEAEAEACGYKTDVKKFYDYNRMRGWQSIQDWRQALALWVTNEPQHRRSAKSMTGADAGLRYDPIPYTVHSIDEVDTENAPSIDIDIDIIDIGG